MALTSLFRVSYVLVSYVNGISWSQDLVDEPSEVYSQQPKVNSAKSYMY